MTQQTAPPADQATQQGETQALVPAQPRPPVPMNNGVMHPDTWTMFGRMAQTVANSDFVPRPLRGKPDQIMACLLYGDSLGLHPMVALREVHVIEGRPSMSAALLAGKVRLAGHRLSRKQIVDANGLVVAVTALGERGDTGETDEFTFSLVMATRANLLGKDNWKKYPEAMMWARAASQVCRMLFSDVFLGNAVYTPDEVEEMDDGGDRLRNGGAPTGGRAEAADYGDEPELADALRRHFDALKTLPAKRALLLSGLDDAGRRALLKALAADAREAGVGPAEPEKVEDAEVVTETPAPEPEAEEIPFDVKPLPGLAG